jgi:hypothetical protein
MIQGYKNVLVFGHVGNLYLIPASDHITKRLSIFQYVETRAQVLPAVVYVLG